MALIYSEQIFKKILILVKIKIKLLNQFAFWVSFFWYKIIIWIIIIEIIQSEFKQNFFSKDKCYSESHNLIKRGICFGFGFVLWK